MLCADNTTGDVVLNCICLGTFLDVATEIVKGGANVDFQNAKDGYGALFWAVNCGNVGLINVLLDHGANINVQTLPRTGALTPLHTAVRANKPEEYMVLVQRGADPSIKDAEGLTPLDTARRLGKHVMVQLLSSLQTQQGKRQDGG